MECRKSLIRNSVEGSTGRPLQEKLRKLGKAWPIDTQKNAGTPFQKMPAELSLPVWP
jgi:hypothetical protein